MDAAHKTTTREILDQKIDALKTSPAWIIDDSPLAQWTALRCHDRNITALSFISPRDLLQPVTEGSSFHTALERSELLQSALTEAQRNDLQHYAAISGHHYLKALLAKCPQLLPSIHTFTPSASLWEELSSPDLPIVALYTGVSFVGTPATNLRQHTLYALPPAATPCATCLGFPQDIGFKNFAEYTHQEASIYHLDAASRLAQERSEPCNALALQHLTIAMDLNPSMVQSTRDGILTYLKDNILALQGAAIPSALSLKASNITPGSPLCLAPENASHHLDWLTLVPSYNLYIKTRERHPGMRTLPTYHHLRYQQLAQQEHSTAADDEALRQKYQQLLQLEQLALHHMTQTQNDEAALATINELERLLCADDVSYLRAFYWNLKGDRPKAYAYLNTFLSRYPNNIDALALLATLQLESGALQEVKHKTLPRIRAAAGTEKNYYYLIIQAQIAEKQQRLQEARTAFLQAIETRPREAHERIKETVLTLDMRLDDKHAAKQHASDFLKTDLDFPFAHYILGSLALEENDLDAARFHLKQASLEAARPIAMAYNDLAELHRRQHDYALACDYAQRAYTAQPHLVIAHETAASALIALGQYDRAEAELNTAIETSLRLAPKHPIDARIRLTRAQLFAKTGRLDQARQELRTLSPSTLDAASRKDYDALLQTLP
jgi:Flp pilus assembly protein TadD